MYAMQLMFKSLVAAACIPGALALASTDAIKYGPSNCILISRSGAGSCVITTDCQGVDTSKTEFGFSCVREGDDTQWHSYGNGGFEANEEFDSGMKCDECGGPSANAVRSQSVQSQMTHFEITTPAPAVQYVAAELEPEAPTTQQPAVENVDKAEESWQPSVWSAVPTAMQEPPTAPMGISPERSVPVQSFLRKSSPRLSDVEGADTDFPRAQIQAARTSNSDQSGAVAASNSDSNAASSDGSDDEYVTAAIEPDSPPKAASNKQSLPLAQHSAIQVSAPEVERFGPKNCIATWRNTDGHCILQTKCDDVDLSKVDVGLICVNSDGAETRHSFGKDSFDQDEEFDTMIACSKCSAPRRDKTNKALTEKLQLLSEGIKDLEKGMESISENVQRLNAKVFRKSALTQTRHAPVRRVQRVPTSYSQSDGITEEDQDDEAAELEAAQAEQGEEEEEREEERQRAVLASREEQRKRRCNEGNEFNQGGDC